MLSPDSFTFVRSGHRFGCGTPRTHILVHADRVGGTFAVLCGELRWPVDTEWGEFSYEELCQRCEKRLRDLKGTDDLGWADV